MFARADQGFEIRARLVKVGPVIADIADIAFFAVIAVILLVPFTIIID